MRLTCRATKAAVGAELTSVLRQVDRMMHSVGRRYYQGRSWGRMRQRDWLVLLPDWPCGAPEIAVDEGVRLGVLSVLPAGALGQWLSVDYATLVCRISNAEKDLPPGSGPGPKVSPTLGAWGGAVRSGLQRQAQSGLPMVRPRCDLPSRARWPPLGRYRRGPHGAT